MIKKLEFTCPGKPVAAARPRVGANRRAYLPKKTTDAKKRVSIWAGLANQDNQEIDQPVALVIRFYFAPPKSLRNRRLSGKYRPKKPDIDNLVKTVLDGITMAKVWKDDNLVVDLHCQKMYSEDEHDERTEVELYTLES